MLCYSMRLPLWQQLPYECLRKLLAARMSTTVAKVSYWTAVRFCCIEVLANNMISYRILSYI